jgi:WS/DGAT/MGAT family acyltransferase
MADTMTTRATTASDRPLDWGASPVMSHSDALMWRSDDHREMRGHVCGLELLDRVPDWDRFLAAHDWATRMLPRLRQRVVDSPLRVGVPTWAVDPDFDLGYHVRRLRVPGDGTWTDLLRAAEAIAMTPLDRARPPWEVVLFEGLADGRAAYLGKVHHAVTDGKSSVLALAMLRATSREPQPDKPQPPVPAPEELGALAVMGNQVVHGSHRVPKVVEAVTGGVLGAVTAPREAARRAVDYARSVPRVTGSTSPPGSPLLRGRSLAWRFETFDIGYADLRAAARVAGASVNDAYLAGLTGAFRLYHERSGRPVDVMPFAIPISTRAEGDTSGGNRITVGRVAAPVWLADPVERMLTIKEQVRIARREPAAGMFDAIGPVLAWLPSDVLGPLGRISSVNDVQASNVPGLRHDTYMAGAKIERSYPFGPLPGCAVMATIVTHGSTCCLGVNYDDAAITDRELFAACVVDGFDEVLALVAGASPTYRRV